MQSSNFNLRNVPPQVMAMLKKEAAKKKMSINSFILSMLEQGLGMIRPATKKIIFHDLDHLAGTWSNKDQEEFEKNIKPFEEIDKELWS